MLAKTLILNGSPHINGDTESLIKVITNHINGEYKIVHAVAAVILTILMI